MCIAIQDLYISVHYFDIYIILFFTFLPDILLLGVFLGVVFLADTGLFCGDLALTGVFLGVE